MSTSFRPGVLSRRQLIELTESAVVERSPDPQRAAGTSAIDLTLSTEALMRGSIKGRNGHPYREVLSQPQFVVERFDLTSPRVLLPQQTYIIRLQEALNLEACPDLYGYGSGKSSIGRLDVLVRLVADYAGGYDEIPAFRKSGRGAIALYAEVTPISFPIRVATGVTLNQLRFFQGPAALSELGVEELRLYDGILETPGAEEAEPGDLNGLTVDLSPVTSGAGEGLIGFEGKSAVTEPLDLVTPGKLHDPADYWMPVRPDEGAVETLRVVPERFYILRSRERFNLPPDTAAFVHAVTEHLGELRIHYAGFIHPGFGHGRPGGTPLIFETRGHNIMTFLRHGERMAVIRYFRMSESAEATATGTLSYQEQELNLSRHFTPWRQFEA